MKNILSLTIFALLFLGLGALALTAAPGGTDLLAEAAPVQFAGQDAALPNSVAAPNATQNWNEIAMPLDGTNYIPNAQGIADQISGTQLLQRWNSDPNVQNFEFYVPDPISPGGFGTNFSTSVGGAYFVLVDNSINASTVFTVVGDVPPQSGNAGAVNYTIYGASANCLWNHITVPLDHDAITSAQELANSIGDVQLLQHWNADNAVQNFEFYVPDPVSPGGFGTDFAVKVGYPYFVCLSATKNWPTP